MSESLRQLVSFVPVNLDVLTRVVQSITAGRRWLQHWADFPRGPIHNFSLLQTMQTSKYFRQAPPNHWVLKRKSLPYAPEAASCTKGQHTSYATTAWNTTWNGHKGLTTRRGLPSLRKLLHHFLLGTASRTLMSKCAIPEENRGIKKNRHTCLAVRRKAKKRLALHHHNQRTLALYVSSELPTDEPHPVRLRGCVAGMVLLLQPFHQAPSYSLGLSTPSTHDCQR